MADEVEQAVADVQLLGSLGLIKLMQKFAEDLANNQQADLDDILREIRNHLRSELGEEPVSGRFVWLRIGRSAQPDSDQEIK